MQGIAQIEPLSAVVRFWHDEQSQYGDPYDWVATLRWITPNEVEVIGITKPPTPSVWRAVKAACREMGIERIVFYRMRHGEKVRRELTTR